MFNLNSIDVHIIRFHFFLSLISPFLTSASNLSLSWIGFLTIIKRDKQYNQDYTNEDYKK